MGESERGRKEEGGRAGKRVGEREETIKGDSHSHSSC